MNKIIYAGQHPITYDVRWHTHKALELVYCTSGQGAFRFQDGSEIAYSAGEIVVIPQGDLHANSSKEGFTNIHLIIQESTFPNQPPFKFQDENESLLKAFVEATRYYNSDKPRRELVIAALGDLVISYMIMFLSTSEISEPVSQIRNSILQNHTNPDYALDEFIRTLPFHYDYLRKVFKKEMGMSPLEYMTSMRMKNAERLLSMVWTSGYAVAEVAQMCGYENALYFSRVFKKYYGCSPTQYIKKQRGIHIAEPERFEVIPEE